MDERRQAARRVHRLNRELDTALAGARLHASEERRQAAGRRADDIQDEILAVRDVYPDMTLAEVRESTVELRLTAEELQREHRGWL